MTTPLPTEEEIAEIVKYHIENADRRKDDATAIANGVANELSARLRPAWEAKDVCNEVHAALARAQEAEK